MKLWIILAAVVVALSSTATVAIQYLPVAGSTGGPSFPVGGAGLSDKELWGKPKAVVEGDRYFDFGTMPQQVVGKHNWVVRNEGQGVLELWMISSTCSCTLAKFKDGEKAYVKPGETTEITLEFETRSNNGTYEKGAEIGSNDPKLPQFPLHVRGKVYPAVMVFPPLDSNVVNLLDIGNDDASHFTKLGIFSKDRPETKIVKVTTSAPKHIVCSWAPVKTEELKSMHLEACEQLLIELKTDLPLGPFRHEVVVTTDHPKQPEVRLTLTGTLIGPISLGNPGRLIMHSPVIDGKVGGTGKLDLTVAENRETQFEVVKAPRGITAAVLPAENAKMKGHYRLVVTVPPGTPAQNILSRIELKTDHPKARTLFVPVDIWVADSQ